MPATLLLRNKAWRMQLLFILGYFLPYYLPSNPKIQNFLKMKKYTRRYHHFTHVYQKLWSYYLRFLKYGMWQMDGRTDGWTGRQTNRRSDRLMDWGIDKWTKTLFFDLPFSQNILLEKERKLTEQMHLATDLYTFLNTNHKWDFQATSKTRFH